MKTAFEVGKQNFSYKEFATHSKVSTHVLNGSKLL